MMKPTRIIGCSIFNRFYGCVFVTSGAQLRSRFLYKMVVATEKGLCYNISQWHTSVFVTKTKREELERKMEKSTVYFVVKQKAVPEVLLKVVEAKRLLESEKVPTVQDAVDAVGISRSSFYKYKDDIFQFHDNVQGTTITLTFQMDDEPGVLSDVLKTIADFKANILTIHQSIPINGVASLSLSVQVLKATGNVSEMIASMERQRGVHHVTLLAKE